MRLAANKILLLLFLLIFLLPNSNMQSFGVTSQEEASKLSKGEVVASTLASSGNDSSTIGVESKIFINTPPQKLWNLISHQEKLPEIIPSCKKAEILEKTDNSEKVEYLVKISPFLPVFKYVLNVDQTEKYKKIKYNKIDGSFNKLYGSFEFEPYNNGTILTYKMYIDPGFFVPSFICENGLRNALPDMLKKLKAKAESTPESD